MKESLSKKEGIISGNKMINYSNKYSKKYMYWSEYNFFGPGDKTKNFKSLDESGYHYFRFQHLDNGIKLYEKK